MPKQTDPLRWFDGRGFSPITTNEDAVLTLFPKDREHFYMSKRPLTAPAIKGWQAVKGPPAPLPQWISFQPYPI